MEEYLKELALKRAGFETAEAFLQAKGLSQSALEQALMPYLLGYELYRVRQGDTYGKIAREFGTSADAIMVANPGRNPNNLQIGSVLVVPLDFPLVSDLAPMTWALCHHTLRGLNARYPFMELKVIGSTAYGRALEQVKVGKGPRVVYYNASHHANEWITTPTLLMCLEAYLRAIAFGESLLGNEAQNLYEETTLYLLPMVDPDGVDLVTGAANANEVAAARVISEQYPDIPFPEGWKANLRGVDLNLNYPAKWEQAREIKFEQGYVSPAPRDYVGESPLSEPESQAMEQSTRALSPALTIAWHTQGQEIYYKFLDLEPEGARALGQQMALASGYALQEVPYASSFAGYKDWFIQDFDRPGYTIEAGIGENPLPLSQLPKIYRDNLPIFLLGLTGGVPGQAQEVPTTEKAEETLAQDLSQVRWG